MSDSTRFNSDDIKQSAKNLGDIMQDMSAFKDLEQQDPDSGTFNTAQWLKRIVSDRRDAIVEHAHRLNIVLGDLQTGLTSIAENFTDVDGANAAQVSAQLQGVESTIAGDIGNYDEDHGGSGDVVAPPAAGGYGQGGYGQGQYGYPDPSQGGYGYPAAQTGYGYPDPSTQGGYGYPSSGYPSSGYPSSGYPSSGYPSSGYPSSGYPSSGYPSSGYPSSGYPSSGYPSSGYPASPGYPAQPLQPTLRDEAVPAEPLQPAYRSVAESVPLEPRQYGVPAEPLQPAYRPVTESVPAEPVQYAEPVQRLEPVEYGVPQQPMSAEEAEQRARAYFESGEGTASS